VRLEPLDLCARVDVESDAVEAVELRYKPDIRVVSEIAREAIYEELQEHPERWDPVYVRELVDDGEAIREIRDEMMPRAVKTFLKSVRDAEQRDKTPANGGHETLAA